jgi:hypothetical protein
VTMVTGARLVAQVLRSVPRLPDASDAIV